MYDVAIASFALPARWECRQPGDYVRSAVESGLGVEWAQVRQLTHFVGSFAKQFRAWQYWH